MEASVMMLTAKLVNMVKNLAKHTPLSARPEPPLIALMCSGRLTKHAIRSTPAKLVISILSGVKPRWRLLKINARIIEFAMIPRKHDVPRAMFCAANPGHCRSDFPRFDSPSEKVWFVKLGIFALCSYVLLSAGFAKTLCEIWDHAPADKWLGKNS